MNSPLGQDLEHVIKIRPAASVADYRQCQAAQRQAWGITEDGYVIPVATMVGAQHHGGLVLGAFLDDGTAVAMSFAFLGRIGSRGCLYSQLTGVVPGYQSHGLGYRIKMTQREFAASQGIPTIAWAFDPLQAGNARFNLDKLGARATRFIENMYGERTDRLNSGIPTDRLIAEWDVAVTDEETAVDPDVHREPLELVRIDPSGGGLPVPAEILDATGSSRARIRIPADIAQLRRERPELAEAWRVAVKAAFMTAFGKGFRAIGFVREKIPSGDECYYVLARGTNTGA